MTDDLMRMASFRIDKELWAKFGAVAKRERLTVTDVLTDYIQRCTDNDRTEYAVNTGNDSTVITDNYDTDKLNDVVNTRINEAIDNRILPLIESVTARVMADELMKTLTDATVLEELVKVNIEPLAALLAELEAYTQSQITAMREEVRVIADRAVEIPVSTAPIPTHPRKENPKADSLPEWVRKDDRRFYSLLVGDSELLDKVAEAIDLSADSKELAANLMRLKLYAIGKDKREKALDSSSVSRVKYVVSHLKTAPESTLPLFPD